MLKNLILLGFLTWVSTGHTVTPMVAQESIHEAESFKLETAVEEQEAQRSVAGSKIKKKKKFEDAPERSEKASGQDSEVRYWQYSE